MMSADPKSTRAFSIRDVVIVNPGVSDPDLNIEIGGWQGEITDILVCDGEQLVTIAWDEATLQRMEPWVIDYCNQEGIDDKQMTLGVAEISLVTSRDTTSDEMSLGLHLRALTRTAVQQLADSPAVFERGVQYLHSDAIHQFAVTSRGITARVYGHYGDYTVEVVDTPDELEMTCTCPYEGLVCKHLVAVLLRFVEMEKTDILDVALPDVVRQTLAAMSREELLNLLIALSNERDEFRRALMARLTIAPELIARQPRSADQVQALKQQIARFFDGLTHRSYGRHGYYNENEDEDFEDEFYEENMTRRKHIRNLIRSSKSRERSIRSISRRCSGMC